MKKVERKELLDLGAYEEIRVHFRGAVIEEKMGRRFSISDELSIVFENHRTVLFQIQEMLRTERITKEASIQHEIDTYNELIPARNELSGTLFVEIADHDTRERRAGTDLRAGGRDASLGRALRRAQRDPGRVARPHDGGPLLEVSFVGDRGRVHRGDEPDRARIGAIQRSPSPSEHHDAAAARGPARDRRGPGRRVNPRAIA